MTTTSERQSSSSKSSPQPIFKATDWDEKRYSIEYWLKHTAQGRLADTTYGMSAELPPARDEVFEDPLLSQVYRMDMATFLTAERVSLVGVSGLIRHAEDESSRLTMAAQTLDEARHFEVFARHLADAGASPDDRERLMDHVTTPALKKFYDRIYEAVDAGDYHAGSVALNLILEGMAYPVYRYESKYWSTMDPRLSSIIKGAFADEVQHVGFGEKSTAAAIKKDAAVRNRISKVLSELHVLMTEVFEEIIQHHIGLYQAAANCHLEVMGDIEIFPGRKMGDTPEEEQVRILLRDVQAEYRTRLNRVGLGP